MKLRKVEENKNSHIHISRQSTQVVFFYNHRGFIYQSFDAYDIHAHAHFLNHNLGVWFLVKLWMLACSIKWYQFFSSYEHLAHYMHKHKMCSVKCTFTHARVHTCSMKCTIKITKFIGIQWSIEHVVRHICENTMHELLLSFCAFGMSECTQQ